MYSEFVLKGLSADLERQSFIEGVLSSGNTWVSFLVPDGFPSFLTSNLRRAARPPRPLPKDYRHLCLYFLLEDAKDDTRDFQIPELVQAIFYAMVVNEALELHILSRGSTKGLKSAFTGLRWSTFESRLKANRSTLIAARRPWPSDAGMGPLLASGQEESSRSNDKPPLPSEDDDE
ncbi:hypothetical protein Cgig2_005815 [Carnegiea gigantea]|uniref:Uncharacterized protein n=1 Tax=Carnegiea gigantea TaxID=171969 RepID=A0A9Q1KMJ7_9CARY|nr:hypothetical protein Cgig2_005815 [Carnegiea gigantea]